MKAIKKTDKNFSFKLKAFIFLVVGLAFTSFFFSLKYSGNSKDDFPVLHFSEKIIKPECITPAGFYDSFVFVELNSNTNNKIYYTIDGSEPSLASILYNKKFLLKEICPIISNMPTEMPFIPTIFFLPLSAYLQI